MKQLKSAIFLIMIYAVTICMAENNPDGLSIAKAIDKEILQLKDLPDETRAAVYTLYPENTIAAITMRTHSHTSHLTEAFNKNH